MITPKMYAIPEVLWIRPDSILNLHVERNLLTFMFHQQRNEAMAFETVSAYIAFPDLTLFTS